MATKPILQKFVLAKNSKIVLNPHTADELVVKGLQGMGLCLGFTMGTVAIEEIGTKISLEVPTIGKYEASTSNYNFIPGDKALEVFRNASLNGLLITAIRLYVVDGGDFSAPDRISDPASGLYIGSITDPRVDSPSGLYTGSLSYMPGGTFVLFTVHTQGANLAFDSVANTFTCSDNSFISAGFEVGDTIMADNFGSLAPLCLKVTTVAAGVLGIDTTAGDAALLTANISGTATSAIHGATPVVV